MPVHTTDGKKSHLLDAASEVAPPGYEHVVKGLKKNPSVDNPWAVAWWMKGQGISPKKKVKARKTSEGDGTPRVTSEVVEAASSTTHAALLRGTSEDDGSGSGDDLPVNAFRADVHRKEGIFASMHADKGLQPKEVVNYRYASNPNQSCASCEHFNGQEGSCEKVIGMIRPIDLCDLWTQRTQTTDAMAQLRQRLMAQTAPRPAAPITSPQPSAVTSAPVIPATVPRVRASMVSEAEWDESKHPRGAGGKFGSGGGGTAVADETTTDRDRITGLATSLKAGLADMRQQGFEPTDATTASTWREELKLGKKVWDGNDSVRIVKFGQTKDAADPVTVALVRNFHSGLYSTVPVNLLSKNKF